jgi:hypothetical protein
MTINMKEINLRRAAEANLNALKEENVGLLACIRKLKTELPKQNRDTEELILYKQALTKAVSLPAGSLPQGYRYDSTMVNGNVVITKARG